MPKPPKGPRLGSGPAHERLLLAGLAADLIRHERVRTTEAKAKRLRPVAERLVTLGKDGSVHARRRALSVVRDREVVHKLFAEVAPRYTERMGGYTRILKLGTRKGDAAPMALIEWVEGEAVAVATEQEGKRRRGLLRRRGQEEGERGGRSRSWRPGADEEEPKKGRGREAASEEAASDEEEPKKGRAREAVPEEAADTGGETAGTAAEPEPPAEPATEPPADLEDGAPA